MTNQQYLAFVIVQPRWRRSRVARLFADLLYLEHWQDDLSLANLHQPVADTIAAIHRVAQTPTL